MGFLGGGREIFGGRGDVEDEFRIDLQLVDDWVLLMSRWDRRSQFDDVVGYNRAFANAFTSPYPGCTDGSSHHRISAMVGWCAG
jgi:hypothetical protein